ncbi:MAG: hypothetical protein SGPRY_003330, partial [Prymnesium sp.]
LRPELRVLRELLRVERRKASSAASHTPVEGSLASHSQPSHACQVSMLKQHATQQKEDAPVIYSSKDVLRLLQNSSEEGIGLVSTGANKSLAPQQFSVSRSGGKCGAHDVYNHR